MAITANSTDYVLVAVGTTAQRPGSPTVGMLRVNTTTNQLEFYTGSMWATWVQF